MRKGELTRLEILETALPLAARVGLSGLTIGGLAEALGMSKSGLFAHFRSKEALELAVLEFAAARFIEIVIQPTLRHPRGIPRVRALLDHWFSWLDEAMAEGGCFFTAAAVELDDRPGPVRERLVAQQRDFLEFIASVVRAAVSEGQLRGDLDADQFAHDLFGILLASQHYTRLLRDPKARERAETALEALIDAARSSSRGE